MKEIRYSTQFRKDFKRYRGQPQKIKLLEALLNYLANDIPIPASYVPHMLHGKYEGCMECHIQGDYLLIWYDESSDSILLQRLGSHSELFK
ncbi:MAG: type II toxin-antitoxin system YafQ family toxin [Bacteroidaceae bacterium]|nr:type II toxin-antitoxin system YafQ family toxin [Bacteroidaceae bacterium]